MLISAFKTQPFIFFSSKVFNSVGTRLLHMGMGFIILFRVITEFKYAPYFYGSEGSAMGSATQIFGSFLGLGIDAILHIPFVTYIIPILWGMSAIGLLTGNLIKLSIAVALFCYTLDGSLTNIQDGGDNLAKILLFYMLFMIPYKHVENVKRNALRIYIHNLAVLAVYIQICLLYLVSGTAKLGGEMWMNGTAIYYVVHTEAFSAPWEWLKDVFKQPLIVAVATYMTLIYQLGFPFMLLNRLHLLWVLLGLGMHFGIALAMGLVPFAMIMMTVILFTIRDSEWKAIINFFADKRMDSIVFIDGYCSHCVKTGQLIKSVDWLSQMKVVSFRHDECFLEYGLNKNDLEKEMHIIVKSRGSVNTYSGYESLSKIVSLAPLLWPFIVPAWILGKTSLGTLLYSYLANNRIIVPNSNYCKNNSCSIESMELKSTVIKNN